ncbi:MAG TPA: DUF1993 domain-containing protein [Kofleriaceae bacterium]|nr:DUF1993 domain-containing protein [Kofleriaceae bacterium]
MPITLHELAIDTFVHMLGTLTHVLDKAAKHAEARKFPVDDLVNARLAPDMLPLSTQVYLACHHAKDGPARLLGQEPPMVGRGLQENFEQINARIHATLEHVRGLPKAEIDAAEQRRVTITITPERVFDMTGFQLIRDWTLPHFYFHVVTAYDILRESGVEIGKRDYAPHAAAYLRKV